MKVAVVGVTGLVGTRMVEVLEERNFPVDEFIPVASGRSVGKMIAFKGKDYPVVSAEEAISRKPDLALFSAGADISRELAPKFAAVGCRVVDNSSCWRMDPTKKLVVPEINADVLEKEDYIIANPNCSTIQMLLPLALLHEKYVIKRIVVSTYQSVTGSGTPAMNQMQTERNGGKWGEYPAFYHYPIDQNVIPHIDDFLENGYTKEEMKMVNETQKIFDDYDMRITATTVRVPVYRSHSESVNVEFEHDLDLADMRKALENFPGVQVQDNLEEQIYPMPLYTSDKDDCYVGRLRRDFSNPNTFNFWVVGDQIRKGAALNTLQIAECMIKNGWV